MIPADQTDLTALLQWAALVAGVVAIAGVIRLFEIVQVRLWARPRYTLPDLLRRLDRNPPPRLTQPGDPEKHRLDGPARVDLIQRRRA